MKPKDNSCAALRLVDFLRVGDAISCAWFAGFRFRSVVPYVLMLSTIDWISVAELCASENGSLQTNSLDRCVERCCAIAAPVRFRGLA